MVQQRATYQYLVVFPVPLWAETRLDTTARAKTESLMRVMIVVCTKVVGIIKRYNEDAKVDTISECG